MKVQSILTLFAVTAALALPACASHKKDGSDIKTEREVISGDVNSGNYVERVTEVGPNFSRTTTVTHSVETAVVPASTIKHPNSTVRSVKERTVRKVMKDGKIKVEETASQNQTVTPNKK
jgi:hypothetical protein